MAMQGPDGTVGVPLSDLSMDDLKKRLEDSERMPPELVELFTYHAPTEEQKHSYTLIRETAMRLAKVINDHCPAGPDRTAAVRKIREAVMTANASIATGNAQYR